MRVIDIFYYRFFNDDGSGVNIGGVETYINNLIKLAEELNISSRVFQFSNRVFEQSFGSAVVYGCKRRKNSTFKQLYLKAISTRSEENTYISIIANDSLIPRWKVQNSIVIQHGIGFDDSNHADLPFFVSFLYRALKSYKRVKSLQNIEDLVCVDYNFICWYRTQTPKRKVHLIPILNFAGIGSDNRELKENASIVKLVFARRFVPMRGTRLIAPVILDLLNRYEFLEVTFAGEGPEECFLRSLFNSNKRVHFTSYNAENSISFHQEFDIAVIPTAFSEGTSLSLLEAMSAGCAVVCTNVGGMTNVIIDDFNGLIVSPYQRDLSQALSRLIESPSLRKRLAANAKETIRSSFSIDKWKEKWTELLLSKFEHCI